MKPETWEMLDRAFAESPILRAHAEPVSDSELDAAERALGVRFDPDYREFVLRYGGAMVGAYPIYGLRPVELFDDTLWSVTVVTRHYRDEGWPCTDGWYVISTDHGGNPIGMDAAGAVQVFDHDFGGLSVLAESFEDYVIELLDD